MIAAVAAAAAAAAAPSSALLPTSRLVFLLWLGVLLGVLFGDTKSSRDGMSSESRTDGFDGPERSSRRGD
jgi:hypothetical protein